ncbi:MAG: SWIM zinc finger domain-containing protein [Oligosphaeraceae bacterium]
MTTFSDLDFDHALTEAELLRLSSSQTYFRGEQCRSRGAVRGLRLEDGTLTGEVQGRQTYRGRLRLEAGVLTGDCTCFGHHEGSLCKHLVALGLAYLQARSAPGTVANIPPSPEAARLPLGCRQELLKMLDEALELARTVQETSGAEQGGHWTSRRRAGAGDGAFHRQCGLLSDALSKLTTEQECRELWEVSVTGLTRFMTVPTKCCRAVYGVMEWLSDECVRAVCGGGCAPVRMLETLAGWERQADSVDVALLSRLLFRLPRALRDDWGRAAQAEWRSCPAIGMGEPPASGRRQYLERNLRRWADERGDVALRLELMERQLAQAGDVLALIEAYRRYGRVAPILPLLRRALAVWPDHVALRERYEEMRREFGS